MRHHKLIINDDSHLNFFLSYVNPICPSFFIKSIFLNFHFWKNLNFRSENWLHQFSSLCTMSRSIIFENQEQMQCVNFGFDDFFPSARNELDTCSLNQKLCLIKKQIPIRSSTRSLNQHLSELWIRRFFPKRTQGGHLQSESEVMFYKIKWKMKQYTNQILDQIPDQDLNQIP